MTEQKKQAENLIDFLYDNPTGGFFVVNTSRIFKNHGFKKLELDQNWDTLQPNGKYYVTKDNAALFAFTIPAKGFTGGFKIVGTHVDSPALKIKPNPELIKEGYLQLNTEVYGGPILATWFDRPLAAAGKIYSKGSDPFRPICNFVNIQRPLAVIPSLAIHMNREVNKSFGINNQQHLLPVLQTVLDEEFAKEDYLLKLLSKESGIAVSNILDFELYLYDQQKGSLFGVEEEFISAGRIDDQEACFAGIQALLDGEGKKSINLLACFDNEEIGSSTKQGADSQLLSNLLERIILSLGGNREDFLVCLEKSFLISADGAHSVHPNYGDKSDPTSRPSINKGPVVKISANQKYTSDVETTSVIKEIAEKAEVPLQFFVNHSNERGGSTIGPLSSRHLDIKAVDLGVAMLGMHSIRETIGVADHLYLMKLLTAFYME